MYNICAFSSRRLAGLTFLGRQLAGKPEKTEGWDKFKEVGLGQVKIDQAGDQVVNIRPKNPGDWKAMNLRFVKLSPKPN